ncbi:hypothetical protein B296_00051806 [Ensete ventricosum]|uniref:30S ribosomal protein S9, chloroplastic n=1 Tax=Ensete ventricosum TaxID=4639 RepID=A0A426XSU2_ENSVE|nr:hypothetical protein B296_00051806 [Ensete ventricosum]
MKVQGFESSYDVFVKAQGGGLSGQAQAISLGIARALLKVSGNHRSPLKKEGLLTRDSRVVERKKVGLKKARKAPQFSKHVSATDSGGTSVGPRIYTIAGQVAKRFDGAQLEVCDRARVDERQIHVATRIRVLSRSGQHTHAKATAVVDSRRSPARAVELLAPRRWTASAPPPAIS